MTSALPEVLEKLERATVGPLEALHPCDPADTWHDVRSDDDGVIVARCQFAEDAEAIAAAVNWLREHGPALLRDAGDAKDAARYRKLQAWYLSGAKMSEIDPLGHIRFTTPEIIDAALDAMHAPGGAGGGS